ncbi:MAG: thermonuclease family protein [Pseudomonadota bacterium]
MIRLLVIGALLLTPTVATAAPPGCNPLYIYKATITRVIDGDTVVANIDLGFDTWRNNERVRLHGIDAPEMRGDERQAGLRAKAALAGAIEGRRVIVCTIPDRNGRDRTGSFRRYLGRIFTVEGQPFSINAWMVLRGFAKPYAR